MDLYTVTLVLGGAGLAAMAVGGAVHLGGHGGAHSEVPGGHDVHLGAHHLPHAYGHVTHAHGLPRGGHASNHGSIGGSVKAAVLSLASPRVLFGLLLGFGAVGVVLRPVLFGVWLPLCALLGALVLELGVFAPVWRFFLRFASNPAQTLDTSVLSEVRATSGFNADGEGLVAVEVDGQIVQCLGTLRADDRELGVRVRAGDVLRVESVDSARQRCTVSYVRHGSDAT